MGERVREVLLSLVGKKVTFVRHGDNQPFIGTVTEYDSPEALIEFDRSPALKTGDELVCGIGDGVNFCKLASVVVSVCDNSASLWVTVSALQPGAQRAMRIPVQGEYIEISSDDPSFKTKAGVGLDESQCYICDISETGLKVKGYTRAKISTTLEGSVAASGSDIKFKAKVVRIEQELDSEMVEMGLQIIDIDRLSRARWLHMISCLSQCRRAA